MTIRPPATLGLFSRSKVHPLNLQITKSLHVVLSALKEIRPSVGTIRKLFHWRKAESEVPVVLVHVVDTIYEFAKNLMIYLACFHDGFHYSHEGSHGLCRVILVSFQEIERVIFLLRRSSHAWYLQSQESDS